MNNVNLIMGGFASHHNIWVNIIELLKKHPFIIEPDVTIRALFDNFGGCTWNCGATLFGRVALSPEIKSISEYYNSNNIPLRLTMTNPLIEESDLYDRYANMIMETCHNGFNEVLVSSSLLEEYIRDTYPNYKICRSIIASENIPYDASDKYEMSVLRRKYNNDWEFLESIPTDERRKIELLCNESCIEDCPRQYSHYGVYGKAQLAFDPTIKDIQCSHFLNGKRTAFQNYDLISRRSFISPEAMRKEYVTKGFTNFKLSGRLESWNIIENFARYVIKEEYQQDFRINVWESILHS